jgi:hypothetical protein
MRFRTCKKGARTLYETQSEDKAVAEDKSAYEDPNQTFIKVPNELVPVVRELIAKRSELPQNALINLLSYWRNSESILSEINIFSSDW